MSVVSLCDERGVAELLIFPSVLARAGQVLESGAILVATGVVAADDEHGLGLTVERVQVIPARGRAERGGAIASSADPSAPARGLRTR